jgi:cell pole-organizing protein PopZ
MTQPAKVQEPSMEEILASIRRIIADDEAKPAVAEKPASPAPAPKLEKPAAPQPVAKAPVMNNIPPSAIPAAQAAAAKVVPPPVRPTPPPPPPPPPPAAAAPVVSNSQDDIDAMLAGLDEATSEAEIRPAAPEAEVFELTDAMAVPDPPQPPFHRIEPHDDLDFTDSSSARTLHRQPAFEPPPFETTSPQQILSRSTVSAVESAFNSLANTVLSNNARTLEDLVKEMLRPMLKSWLDDNLPGLVERIVKAEIERVSRGR